MIDDLPELDLPDFTGVDGFDLDLSAFDIGDIPQGPVETRYIKPRVTRQVPAHRVKYDRARDLVLAMGRDIIAGHRVDAIVSGNFVFGDFIEALLVEMDAKADDLTLSTLAISQENVDSLHNLMTGDYVGTLNLIVSDYFWSHNWRQNAAYIYNALDIDDRFQLAVAGVHTKIALMRIGEWKLIISGSANLRSARCVEVFTVETNPDLYDFHKDWHDKLIAEHATIQKSLRADKAFAAITQEA
jgi:hypothetical protein